MPESAHSTTGLSVRGIVGTALAVLIVIALVLLGLRGLSALYDIPAEEGPNAPLRLQIPGAMLESAPQTDLQRYLAEKQRQLDSWQWVDAQHTAARIPINEAMRMLTHGGAAPRGEPAP